MSSLFSFFHRYQFFFEAIVESQSKKLKTTNDDDEDEEDDNAEAEAELLAENKAASEWDEEMVPVPVDTALLSDLMDMGFSDVRARKGLVHGTSLDGALAWISEHQDDAGIDQPYMVHIFSETPFICVSLFLSLSRSISLLCLLFIFKSSICLSVSLPVHLFFNLSPCQLESQQRFFCMSCADFLYIHSIVFLVLFISLFYGW